MYATRRAIQLARACRTGFHGASRRPISLGATRLSSLWSPAKAQLSRTAAAVNCSPLARAVLRRGYAGMPYEVDRTV